MNKALLRKVAAKLRRLRHEEHYEQCEWLEKTSCGTSACIAGHAALVAGWRQTYNRNFEDYSDVKKGRRICSAGDVGALEIGLPSNHWLFGTSPWVDWPEPFATRWEQVLMGDSKERPSRIAADLLDALAAGKVKP